MLGNAGAPYVCSHEHAGGDHCLAVTYDANTIAEVGAISGVRKVAAPFDVPALAAWVLRAQAEPRRACPSTRPSRRDRDRAVAAMLHFDEHSGDDLPLAPSTSSARFARRSA